MNPSGLELGFSVIAKCSALRMATVILCPKDIYLEPGWVFSRLFRPALELYSSVGGRIKQLPGQAVAKRIG